MKWVEMKWRQMKWLELKWLEIKSLKFSDVTLHIIEYLISIKDLAYVGLMKMGLTLHRVKHMI